MAKKYDNPYIPSYAGLFRFREEKSKIVLDPKDILLISVILAGLVLLLHLLY